MVTENLRLYYFVRAKLAIRSIWSNLLKYLIKKNFDFALLLLIFNFTAVNFITLSNICVTYTAQIFVIKCLQDMQTLYPTGHRTQTSCGSLSLARHFIETVEI